MKQFQKAIFKHCESLFLSRFLQLFFSSLVIEAKGHAVVINDAFCTKILQDISRSLKKQELQLELCVHLLDSSKACRPSISLGH